MPSAECDSKSVALVSFFMVQQRAQVNPAHQDGNRRHGQRWSQRWTPTSTTSPGAARAWCGIPGTVPRMCHDLYPRVLGNEAASASDGQPDAVVIFLGDNDTETLPTKGEDALIEVFHRFLERVRELRAAAAICVLVAPLDSISVCVSSQEVQAECSSTMSRCWGLAIEKLGDSRVFSDVVAPNPLCSLSEPADWGQMGHGQQGVGRR